MRTASFIAFVFGIILTLILTLLLQPSVCHAQGREPGDPRTMVNIGSYTGTYTGPWTGATRTSPNGAGVGIVVPAGDPTDDGTVGQYFDYKALQLQRATRAAQEALSRIHFAFDKSDVGPQYGPELDRIALLLRSNPEIVLHLDGHTDLVGSDSYNNQLGARRAGAVREALILRGVQPSQLAASTFGETMPLVPVTTPEELNRRVESGAQIVIPGATRK